jgi:predicted secreted protein
VVLCTGVCGLWAGDTASFVDLGFSPDGKTYMFAQYGIESKTLKPWADLFVVDVPRNNFVNGGRLSFIGDNPAVAGQDGSGAQHHRTGKLKPLILIRGITPIQPEGLAVSRSFCS